MEAATERRRLLLAAMAYLDDSGQSEAIGDLPVDDVAAMTRVARELDTANGREGVLVLKSRIAELRAEREQAESLRRSRSTSLDAGLVVRVQQRVDEAVTAPQEPSWDLQDGTDLSTDREHD